MRILHVITRLILGGAQQNTVMSCRAQVDAGHEVHLAYGPIHGPEGSLLGEARASGATLHEVPTMVRELAPWTDLRCYRALRRLVRDTRPDLVHSHSSKAGILARAAAWAERTNPQALQAFAEARANGRKLLYIADPRDRRPQVLHTVHGLPFHDRQRAAVRRLYFSLERYAAKRCDHLIAITPAMVEAFVEHRIAPRERFTVIPSGVDTAAFPLPAPGKRGAVRDRLSIPRDARVVGHVGRLDPLKGHADLLDILPDLQEAGRETWLLFVGDGFHRSILEAHPNYRTGRVVMTGLVPLADVPGYLAAMDVMALPSYQEGQSRTLCEALLCGVAVAAYDVGGIPSVCLDGTTGRLVPVGDKPALAAALRQLLGDPAYAATLAARGREHVMQHFSAERMNRELLVLYGRLMGERDESRR